MLEAYGRPTTGTEEAVRAGATSIEPPNDEPNGERSATVKDPFGNTWYLAMYVGPADM